MYRAPADDKPGLPSLSVTDCKSLWENEPRLKRGELFDWLIVNSIDNQRDVAFYSLLLKQG